MLQTCCAFGQRGWKRQAGGGLVGLGTSPAEPRAFCGWRKLGVRHRDRRQQSARVGVAGMGVERVVVGQLDHLPRYMTAIRSHIGHDREVVRDQDQGQSELPLEAAQQVQDLGLDRDVEHGYRLVREDQVRLQCERSRDADPLALAAGELVRVAVVVLRGEADLLHELLHGGRRGALALVQPVDRERLGDDRAEVLRGLSEEYGSWKTICTSRRSGFSARRAQVRDVRAVEADVPLVGSSSRTIRRAVVVLPQPVSPTMPSVSPRRTSKETPSTACTAPTCLRNTKPRVSGKS